MTLEELCTRLSRGELSNLALGNEGRGSIKEQDIPKIVEHANDGLMRIYARFLLDTKQLIIEQVAHITNYHLMAKFAESSGSNEHYKYIKDLPDEPYTGDAIKILDVHDSQGRKFKLNDKMDPLSLFTPAPQTLQVPRPNAGVPLGIEYQARHFILKDEGQDFLSQEIELPFVLEGALQSFVAYKIFSHMNGQDNLVKSQEHLNTFDSICVDVEARDLVNATFATSHHKLEARGFV